MKKLNRIVFIDHEKWASDYYRFLCDKECVGTEALCFVSGESALDYLERVNEDDFPELILIDVQLGDMQYLDLAGRVQQMSAFDEDRTVLAYLTDAIQNKDKSTGYKNEVHHSFSRKVADFDIKTIVEGVFGK